MSVVTFRGALYFTVKDLSIYLFAGDMETQVKVIVEMFISSMFSISEMNMVSTESIYKDTGDTENALNKAQT